MTAPDWLTTRDGELRLAPNRRTWLVLLSGTPQYKLTPTPAGGKHTCEVLQAVNQKRIDKGQYYATSDDALRGGLDELRIALGW
ncbi:MAG: hypothetical protein U0746_01535 [Gemmataceae bacterium]